MGFDVGAEEEAEALGGVEHVLAVDFDLGQVEDGGRDGGVVEGCAHEPGLEVVFGGGHGFLGWRCQLCVFDGWTLSVDGRVRSGTDVVVEDGELRGI